MEIRKVSEWVGLLERIKAVKLDKRWALKMVAKMVGKLVHWLVLMKDNWLVHQRVDRKDNLMVDLMGTLLAVRKVIQMDEWKVVPLVERLVRRLVIKLELLTVEQRVALMELKWVLLKVASMVEKRVLS
jgi:hypothetical protein